MITYVEGDATEPIGEGPKLIAHICNDAGKFGAGFAKALAQRYPLAKERYISWHGGSKLVPFELGKVQILMVDTGIWVANMIAQHGIGPDGDVPPIRYDALRTCLRTVTLFQPEISIHMPRIGTGLAGGEWQKVRPIIDAELSRIGVTVTVYDLPGSEPVLFVPGKWRTARIEHTCRHCSHQILPRSRYFEYLGEVPMAQTGHAYHRQCAIVVWSQF